MTEEARNVEEICKKVEAIMAQEAAAYPPLKAKQEEISSTKIHQCLDCGETGLGALYALVNSDYLIYSNLHEKWLVDRKHFLEFDLMNEALIAAEKVVTVLLNELDAVKSRLVDAVRQGEKAAEKNLQFKEHALIRAIKYLRTDHGRTVTLKMSRTCPDPLAIRGDELDRHPHLLGCRNGVLDLRTAKFGDGRRDYWISKPCPTEWRGLHAAAPCWDRTLLEVFDGDSELVDYVHRLFGYAITGWQREHLFVVLDGDGRNGKGTIVETLRSVLGSLAIPIQSELLLDQGRIRSSSGPSPDLVALRGARIVFASETDIGRRFSPARVKWLSGGDSIVARDIQEKQIIFEPSHHLFLITNHKPNADSTDFAFWERMRVIPFRLAFVDREPVTRHERRARLEVRQELKSEASGILAWLVRGCLEYQDRGVVPPRVVRDATAEYRRSEDVLSDFLAERTVLHPLGKVSAKDFHKAFCEWYSDNVSSKFLVSKRRFGDLMKNRFDKSEPGGYVYYNGVRLKSGDE